MSEGTGVEQSGGEDGEGQLTKSEIFDVLRNQRRRFVLQYLKHAEGPVELGDMATQVAAWEYTTEPGEVSAAQRKRVYTTLQQTHLPRMDEGGILAYDSEEGVIRATDQTETMSVYLEIVPANEFAWREFYLAVGAVSCGLVAALAGDVYPLTMLSDLAWAGIIAATVTLSAVVHIYHERNMRLGGGEVPPELEFER